MLHLKEHGQQVKASDFLPLLHSGETLQLSSGVQHKKGLNLIDRVQSRITELIKGLSLPSICRQAEEIWTVQPGEEKVAWKPHRNLPVPERGLQGSQRGSHLQELWC